MHVIPEEAREDDEDEEEGSKPGNSDEDSNEFSDDIEHLLAPQEQSQKKEWVLILHLLWQKHTEIRFSHYIYIFSEKRT